MGKQISEGRKAAYYVGMGLIVVGALLFASTFVTFIAHFGDFSNFESRAKADAARAFGGMALIVIVTSRLPFQERSPLRPPLSHAAYCSRRPSMCQSRRQRADVKWTARGDGRGNPSRIPEFDLTQLGGFGKDVIEEGGAWC